jgi:hypothetical protein
MSESPYLLGSFSGHFQQYFSYVVAPFQHHLIADIYIQVQKPSQVTVEDCWYSSDSDKWQAKQIVVNGSGDAIHYIFCIKWEKYGNNDMV